MPSLFFKNLYTHIINLYLIIIRKNLNLIHVLWFFRFFQAVTGKSGKPICVTCKRGEVQTEDSSLCKACPPDFYSWMYPLTIKKSSNNIEVFPACMLCPEGGYCPGRDVIITKAGYWRSSLESDVFVECLDDFAGSVMSACTGSSFFITLSHINASTYI